LIDLKNKQGNKAMNNAIQSSSKASSLFTSRSEGPDDPVDYVFTIQGGKVSAAIPDYKNIRVFRRHNNCFDSGAWGDTIE
jgi:hypothetical protein